MNTYTIASPGMMIPKNSRSRTRKQISNHDTHSTASSSNKLSVNKDLPTITRTSNHTPINSASNHSSESSWIELDFNKTEHQQNKSNDIEITKPVSSVNINMDLEDDEESKSSTTSKLSEDFTDKGKRVSKDENDDDDQSVTSFASESSFAVEVPLDEFFVDSPMPNSSKPTSDNKAGKAPTSFRSETKPSSERSKPVSERSKKSKKHVSPRNKASKKKSKSPMPVQARKRLTEKSGDSNDEVVKEHKKRISPKNKSRSSSKKRSSSSSSKHRRSISQATPPPPPPPPPMDDDEQLLALVDEPATSSVHKKKVKKSSSKSPRTRRRRLRSEDLGNEEKLEKSASSRSLEAKSRRRAKSKSKHRKAPLRSSSNPDIAAARELRRRMKKKAEDSDMAKSRSSSRHRTKRSSNGHESEDDMSKMTSKSRSSSGTRKKRSSNGHESEDEMANISTSRHKEGKKKTRSKSSDPKSRSKSAHRNSEAARRRRKKKPSSKPSTDNPDEVEKPSVQSPAPDEDDDIDPHLQPEAGPMEIMTYSFHCRSDEEEKNKVEGVDNWINSANSSSSSLSYNSFAQFSLDVGAISGLVTDAPDTPNGDNGVGIIPDLDASVASFGTMDASVVMMSGSKSGNRVSLLSAASQSFDHEENFDEGDGKTSRSARSVPTGSSNGIKPEKQLRRRLKKGEAQQNSEIKKKVRRAKSNNLEQIKDSLLAGMAANEHPTRKGISRTKSLSEALEQGNSTLVASKASRRKNAKSSTMSQASMTSKNTTKSKSAHGRAISRSPKPRSPKGKIQRDKFADFFNEREATSFAKDVNNSDNKMSQRSPKPSPTQMNSPMSATQQKNSPLNRGVRRTFSNPLAAMGLHSSTGDRRALLSTSANDSDSDEDYSTHSAKKSFLPKRGLDRTPSQMLAGVRDKMKKTFSVSGHGKNTFDADLDDVALGMRTENGYMGVKERRRLMAESAGRRGQVKNSLYACMDDSDSDVDISSTRYDSEDESGNCRSIGHGSVASEQRRHKQTGPPRRVNSLPMHRRSPHG